MTFKTVPTNHIACAYNICWLACSQSEQERATRHIPLTVSVVKTHRLWLIISKEIPINYRWKDWNQPQEVQGESTFWQSRGEQLWPPNSGIYKSTCSLSKHTVYTTLLPLIWQVGTVPDAPASQMLTHTCLVHFHCGDLKTTHVLVWIQVKVPSGI